MGKDLLEQKALTGRGISAADRLKGITLSLINQLLPDLAVPGYCSRCWVRMELVGSQVTEWRGQYAKAGVHTWECPQCRDLVQQRFAMGNARTFCGDQN